MNHENKHNKMPEPDYPFRPVERNIEDATVYVAVPRSVRGSDGEVVRNPDGTTKTELQTDGRWFVWGHSRENGVDYVYVASWFYDDGVMSEDGDVPAMRKRLTKEAFDRAQKEYAEMRAQNTRESIGALARNGVNLEASADNVNDNDEVLKQEAEAPVNRAEEMLKSLSESDKKELGFFALAAHNKREAQQADNGDLSQYYSGQLGWYLSRMSDKAKKIARNCAAARFGDSNVAF